MDKRREKRKRGKGFLILSYVVKLRVKEVSRDKIAHFLFSLVGDGRDFRIN